MGSTAAICITFYVFVLLCFVVFHNFNKCLLPCSIAFHCFFYLAIFIYCVISLQCKPKWNHFISRQSNADNIFTNGFASIQFGLGYFADLIQILAKRTVAKLLRSIFTCIFCEFNCNQLNQRITKHCDDRKCAG